MTGGKSRDIVALGEAMVEFNQTGENGGRSYLQGFGGDTSNAAIAAARSAGFLPVTLGPRVLRAETAALVALALALG